MPSDGRSGARDQHRMLPDLFGERCARRDLLVDPPGLKHSIHLGAATDRSKDVGSADGARRCSRDAGTTAQIVEMFHLRRRGGTPLTKLDEGNTLISNSEKRQELS